METTHTFIEECKTGLELVAAKLTGIHHYVNTEYIELYLREVRRDIAFLKRGMQLCQFDRERDKEFQYLAQKYRKDYCPSTFYRFFSFDNQVRYVYLRSEIDNILSQREN